MQKTTEVVEIETLTSILEASSAHVAGAEAEAEKLMNAAGFSINPLRAIMAGLHALRMGALRLLGFKSISKASLKELSNAALMVAIEVAKRTGVIGAVVAGGAAIGVTALGVREALTGLRVRKMRRALEGRTFWVAPSLKGADPFKGVIINYNRFNDRTGAAVVDVYNEATQDIESWVEADIVLTANNGGVFNADAALSEEFIRAAAQDGLVPNVAAELERLRESTVAAHAMGRRAVDITAPAAPAAPAPRAPAEGTLGTLMGG